MNTKQHLRLMDSAGIVWVDADLSPSRAVTIVKSYARAGIELQPVGGE